MPRPYSMCSDEECRDRQSAMEVSEWEATSDTHHLSPKERIIDPSLAVSKYRRSAAGTNQRTPRRVVQLIQTWEHLRAIFVHQRIHANQPPRALAATVSFLDDRIRAIQVDLVVSQRTSKALQLQLVRYQLITLYLLSGVSRTIYEPKFAKMALITALVAYWNDGKDSSEQATNNQRHLHDDEILCHTTLCHVAATLTDSSWVEGEPTLATYRQYASKGRIYPKFTAALQVAAAVHAQNYYVALKLLHETMSSVLCRLCIAPCLNRLRWLCLCHCNKAFMKSEKLLPEEVARLLFLPNATAALDFGTNAGLPVDENGRIVFKAAPMKEFKSYDVNRSVDDWFCWGSTEECRIDSDHVRIPSHELLLQLIVQG